MATQECSFSLNPLEGFRHCVDIEPESNSVYIGIALAILASCMNCLGINLQKVGSRRGSAMITTLGLVLASATGIVDMASFAFAPQSLLAPFGACTLVLNLILAPPLHGQQIRRVDLVSTALVVAGVATCLSNSSFEAVTRTLEELRALPVRPAYVRWAVGLATAVGLAAAHAARGGRLSALCFPLIAGALGGCNALSAKFIGELAGAGAPLLPDLAIAGAAIAVFATSQLAVLNVGIGRYSSLVVVPVFVACFVTFNAVGGGIFFLDFAKFTPEQMQAYAGGLALLVGGVLLLAANPAEEPAAEKAKAS